MNQIFSLPRWFAGGATTLTLLFVVALCLVACSDNHGEPGVVATVNGEPVYLHQLEYKYDLLHLDDQQNLNPSVNQLRNEYGNILGDLIVQKLVTQELARKGLSVTEDELKQAEEKIRADYPEGAFEEVIVEEYIDITFWREQLRAKLALDKFYQDVLRANIRIDYTEAEAYYKQHISDFYLPKRYTFVLISGPSRELVDKATSLYKDGEDIILLSSKLKQVVAKRLRMREDRLPAAWLSALKGLRTGQSTGTLSVETGFQRLVLLDTSPAKVLDPTQAYPLVEQILIDQKLQMEFQAWLEGRLGDSTIRMSRHLLEEADPLEAGENILDQKPAE